MMKIPASFSTYGHGYKRKSALEEANKIIKALWDIIQQLDEKLKISSKNSSLSPSKDWSSKNKSNIKRTEEHKKNPKKRGG